MWKVGDRLVRFSLYGKRLRQSGEVISVVSRRVLRVLWEDGTTGLVTANSSRIFKTDWQSDYQTSTLRSHYRAEITTET